MFLKKIKTPWIIEFRFFFFFWFKEVCKVSKENKKPPTIITFEFQDKEHM